MKIDKSKFEHMDKDLIIKIVLLALIAFFMVMSLITCSAKSSTPTGMPGMRNNSDAKAQANTITVSSKTISKETLQQTIKITGDVSSTSEINIYPDTSGKITKIQKNLGDSVNKGDVIAYVDPSKPGSAYAASPVVSTISGTIIDLPVNLGNTISSSTVVATIGSLTDLEITIQVAEKYSNYLKPGLKAYVSLPSIENETFNATVTKVSPVINKNNRTLEVKLVFSKYDNRIKPGMFATVDLVIQEATNSFVIPKTAIKTYNNKNTVLIIDENNIAQRVEITTGISNDLYIAVKSGLSDGMKVITAGSATEGSTVRIAGEK